VTLSNPADRFLPHPDADWYDATIGTTGGGIKRPYSATPEQRRSYVRFILAGHGGERSWELMELADWEPAALAPWADHVTAFDEALTPLFDVEWPDYWRASLGASDPAVDRLADRIAAAPPTGPHPANWSGGPAFARVHLLIGVDSERALARLAELGHQYKIIDELCHSRGVWVPPTGPAVRRYAREKRLIVTGDMAPEPGLRVLPPADGILADPRGAGCELPLSVVLDVDLALVPGAPRIGRHPFIGSFCEDCEADEDVLDYRGWRPVADGPLAGKLAFDEERTPVCPGNAGELSWEQPRSLALRPSDRYVPYEERGSLTEVGQLGGWPNWAQYPNWPGCCGKPMFHVGQTNLGTFGGVGAHLFGFACECGAGTQISQLT
jgi:hypothetical protein